MTEFQQTVINALLSARDNFSGSDATFAKQMGINPSVYSRIKNGETANRLLSDANFISMARKLNISANSRKWVPARTEVFNMIEEDILFCKENSKGRIMVDDCAIGKTFSARYLSRQLQDCFYIDASQAKSKQLFVRLIARTLGLDYNGKYADVKADIKYYLTTLPGPMIIIDEAGDLDYGAFLDLKEMWNATEGLCGWYMMGADGLRAKIDKGIRNKKVGFREIFSRYSEKYTTVSPTDRHERTNFYNKLIRDVITANMSDPDPATIDQIVRKCLSNDGTGNIGGLRRAESLVILFARDKMQQAQITELTA